MLENIPELMAHCSRCMVMHAAGKWTFTGSTSEFCGFIRLASFWKSGDIHNGRTS